MHSWKVREKKFLRVFLFALRRRKSRRNRKRFIEEEKERDDGLTLFLTAEKTPLSFEEEGHALRHTHTHTLPTLFERREGQRHTHTHTHAKDARARLRKDGATPP